MDTIEPLGQQFKEEGQDCSKQKEQGIEESSDECTALGSFATRIPYAAAQVATDAACRITCKASQYAPHPDSESPVNLRK